MDMFDGVGRRRDQTTGQMVSIGEHSLNGNERDCLLRNNRDGTFTDTGYVNQADRLEDGRGVSVFDYDRDGRLDLLLRNYKQPAQLLHNVAPAGHWLAVKLIGTASNRDAVGARVTLRSGDTVQTREVQAGSGYLSGSSLTLHFGLGEHERADTLEVRWPSGQHTRLSNIDANQRLEVYEGSNSPVPPPYQGGG